MFRESIRKGIPHEYYIESTIAKKAFCVVLGSSKSPRT